MIKCILHLKQTKILEIHLITIWNNLLKTLTAQWNTTVIVYYNILKFYKLFVQSINTHIRSNTNTLDTMHLPQHWCSTLLVATDGVLHKLCDASCQWGESHVDWRRWSNSTSRNPPSSSSSYAHNNRWCREILKAHIQRSSLKTIYNDEFKK